MKTLLLGLAVIPFIWAPLSSASADLVYCEDFNSSTVDEAPGSPFASTATGGLTVRADDGTMGSQFLEISSRSDNANFTFSRFEGNNATTTAPWSPVTTFCFDACFSSTDFGNVTGSKFRLRSRTNGGAGGAGDDVSRSDLDGPEVIPDAVNTYHYVVNNSASSSIVENFAGQSIAAGTWAMYENGVIIESGSNQSTASVGDNVDYLTLWLRGDTTNNVQAFVKLDNFKVYNNIVTVPEPSSMAMLAMGLAFVGVRRRNRK